jgi:hypothetical protein
MRATGKYDDDIRTRVPSEWVDFLETEAHELSEPGETVHVSDLVRDAISEKYPNLDHDG